MQKNYIYFSSKNHSLKNLNVYSISFSWFLLQYFNFIENEHLKELNLNYSNMTLFDAHIQQYFRYQNFLEDKLYWEHIAYVNQLYWE